MRLVDHDLAGRRVAVLADELLEGGDHRRTWAGSDESGRPVAAGQYLLLLQAEDREDVRKIVLVR